MGAITSMAALETVEETTIDTVAMIGAYLDSDAVCDGGRYYDAVSDSADEVYNFHSRNDSIARIGSCGSDCDGGRWGRGSSGSPPSNYQDVDVTSSVRSHTNYKSSEECVSEIVENFD